MQYAPWGWPLWATLSGSCPLLSIWFDQSDALGRRRENPGYLFSSALPAGPLFGSGYIICLKPQHLMGGPCSTAFLRPPHCCCFTYFPDEIGEVGRIMALTDVHVLTPVICEDGTLFSKTHLVDMNKLQIWRWADSPGSCRWTQCGHKGLYTWEARSHS